MIKHQVLKIHLSLFISSYTSFTSKAEGKRRPGKQEGGGGLQPYCERETSSTLMMSSGLYPSLCPVAWSPCDKSPSHTQTRTHCFNCSRHPVTSSFVLMNNIFSLHAVCTGKTQACVLYLVSHTTHNRMKQEAFEIRPWTSEGL